MKYKEKTKYAKIKQLDCVSLLNQRQLERKNLPQGDDSRMFAEKQ